jgi:hypothetical protein
LQIYRLPGYVIDLQLSKSISLFKSCCRIVIFGDGSFCILKCRTSIGSYNWVVLDVVMGFINVFRVIRCWFSSMKIFISNVWSRWLSWAKSFFFSWIMRHRKWMLQGLVGLRSSVGGLGNCGRGWWAVALVGHQLSSGICVQSW